MTVAASLGARCASDLIASMSATTSTSFTPSSSSTAIEPCSLARATATPSSHNETARRARRWAPSGGRDAKRRGAPTRPAPGTCSIWYAMAGAGFAVYQRADRAPHPTPPPAEPADVLEEVEEVRPRAGDLGERLECHGARGVVSESGAHGQREQRRVVARRTAGRADLDDATNGARAVFRDALARVGRVLDRERALADVIRSALRPEDQEPVEARPLCRRARRTRPPSWGPGWSRGYARPAASRDAPGESQSAS